MKKFKLFNIKGDDKINITSDNQTRVIKSLKKQAKRKRKKGKGSLEKQFDTLMFTHSEEEPTSFNSGNGFNFSRALDFQNNYSKFAMKNMHYCVTNREDFTHNNMVPNTSRRDFDVGNSSYQDRKLQLYSGVDKLFHHKRESKSMFKPTKNLNSSIGIPIITKEAQSRCSSNKQNKNFSNLPFKNKIKVIPGINGKNQEFRNKVYRILPKTTNDLRSKDNKKRVFKARKIHSIKKGELRGSIPTLTKYKIPTFKQVDFNDLVPNKAEVNKLAKHGLYMKPSGHRSMENNYINPAKNSRIGSGPSKNKSKYIKSKKITIQGDPQRNISNSVNKKQVQNIKSYKASKTNRVTTNYEDRGNIFNPQLGSYTHNVDDVPLTTLRESTMYNNNVTGIKSNVMGEYVFSKDIVIPNTKREAYTTTNHPQGIVSNIKSSYINNKTKLKNTSRQITQFNTHQGVITNDVGGNYLRNKNEKAKKTIRETTQYNRYGNAHNEIKGRYIRDKNNKARKTIKQTTQFNKHHGIAKNGVSACYIRDKNDIAKRTIKELTLTSHPAMNVSSMYQDSYHRNKGEVAKRTIKEFTLHSTPHMNIGSHDASYHRNKGEKAKPTIKQTTLHSTPHVNVKNVFSEGTYNRSKNDIAKKTIREGTAHTNHTGILGSNVEQPRNREDVNNMCVDDRREILTYNRTPGSKHDGPYVIDKGTYELKEEILYEREYINKHKPIDRNIIDENINAIYSRNKDKVKKIENEYRINYNFISELEKNPYHNNIIHKKEDE